VIKQLSWHLYPGLLFQSSLSYIHTLLWARLRMLHLHFPVREESEKQWDGFDTSYKARHPHQLKTVRALLAKAI